MDTARAYRLLVISNPLLDILAFGNEDLLKKYALKADDAILASEHQMGLYDDLLHNFDAKVIAGGGSNIGRGAQYMLSPDSVFFIGCIGDDKYGERLVQECHQAGMHTEFRIDDTAPTGRCGVVITGHHRSLCTHLAAANEYRLDHLQQPRVWSMVQRSKIIYVEGYHVTVCVPAIISLAEEALASSKTFIFNFCAPFIPEMFGEPLAEILPYTDYVLGNETEARTWAASQGHAAESVTEIARLLVDLPTKKRSGVRTVIITQGSGPTITAEKHRDGHVELNEYPVHKIADEEIKDTNGAGDAWAGGFCAGLVEGCDLGECINRGHWLAHLSIQELGATYPYPKWTYGATA